MAVFFRYVYSWKKSQDIRESIPEISCCLPLTPNP